MCKQKLISNKLDLNQAICVLHISYYSYLLCQKVIEKHDGEKNEMKYSPGENFHYAIFAFKNYFESSGGWLSQARHDIELCRCAYIRVTR
jgi:hypothetical protein